MSAADTDFEIFLVGLPGLESVLRREAMALGFPDPQMVPGGVTFNGDWRDVWQANLYSRCASRVLVRIASFRAPHLATLDKRARKLPWEQFLRPDVPVRIEASSKRSAVYHTGAIAQRVGNAIEAKLGLQPTDSAALCLRVRFDDDLCTLSIDTSGDPLHTRGFKQAVNKAPLRETMAAQLLRACGYGGGEAVLDPMCGSGTFAIEAAEIAAGLAPGRARRFSFEALPGFDAEVFATMKADLPAADLDIAHRFYGSDRDAGAIDMSRANAQRAGIEALTRFEARAISAVTRPEGLDSGLVIVNPPYGDRIGDPGALTGLYASFGRVMREQFSGWRVGMITDKPALAQATGLPFKGPSAPIPHGGLKVRLYQTAALD